MSSPSAPRSDRVSTLELFFDLVFVFTITQLTDVLAEGHDLEALSRVVVMLLLIWWMYDGYAWLTNAIPHHERAPAGAAARRHGRLPDDRAGDPARLRVRRAGVRRSATCS